MIWSNEETLRREEIEKIQLSRLQETVARVYKKVPAYAKKMDEAGVKPEDIQSLADLSKLPFVTKQDMRDNYPFGLFAVDKSELVTLYVANGDRSAEVEAIELYIYELPRGGDIGRIADEHHLIGVLRNFCV